MGSLCRRKVVRCVRIIVLTCSQRPHFVQDSYSFIALGWKLYIVPRIKLNEAEITSPRKRERKNQFYR